MTCGRPFWTSDLLLDEETHKLVSHIVNLRQVQRALQEYPPLQKNKGLPTHTKDLYPVRGLCPTENLEGRVPWGPATTKQKGPYQVLPRTLTAVKLQGVTRWIHWSIVKLVSSKSQQELEGNYSCESLEDFRYLFKRTDKWLHIALVGGPSKPYVSNYHGLILLLFRISSSGKHLLCSCWVW